MFVHVGKARAGQWIINPNGDRSTHKNRRNRAGAKLAFDTEMELDNEPPKKKRLGVTRRINETVSPLFNRSSFESNNIVTAPPSLMLKSESPSTSNRFYPSMYYDQFTSPLLTTTTTTTTCCFADDNHRRIHEPLIKLNRGVTKHLPSQFVDTTREAFPPAPQLDSLQTIHSQTSSSISLSQSQSQWDTHCSGLACCSRVYSSRFLLDEKK